MSIKIAHYKLDETRAQLCGVWKKFQGVPGTVDGEDCHSDCTVLMRSSYAANKPKDIYQPVTVAIPVI
jgi:hypothetical protein